MDNDSRENIRWTSASFDANETGLERRLRASLARVQKPVVPQLKYEVFDLQTGTPHGKYATLDEARAAIAYDELTAWEIWEEDLRLVASKPRDFYREAISIAQGKTMLLPQREHIQALIAQQIEEAR